MHVLLELPNNLNWFPFLQDGYDPKIKQDVHTYYVVPNIVAKDDNGATEAHLVVYNVKVFYSMPKPNFVQNLSRARDAVREANETVHKVYEKKCPDKTLMNSMYMKDVSLAQDTSDINTQHIMFSVQRPSDIQEAQKALARSLMLAADSKAKLVAGPAAGWITNQMMANAVNKKVTMEDEMESKNLVSNQARANAWSNLQFEFKKIDRQMWQEIPYMHAFLDAIPLHPRMLLRFDENDIMFRKKSGAVMEYHVHFETLKSLVALQSPVGHLFDQEK